MERRTEHWAAVRSKPDNETFLSTAYKNPESTSEIYCKGSLKFHVRGETDACTKVSNAVPAALRRCFHVLHASLQYSVPG